MTHTNEWLDSLRLDAAQARVRAAQVTYDRASAELQTARAELLRVTRTRLPVRLANKMPPRKAKPKP